MAVTRPKSGPNFVFGIRRRSDYFKKFLPRQARVVGVLNHVRPARGFRAGQNKSKPDYKSRNLITTEISSMVAPLLSHEHRSFLRGCMV